MKIFQKKIKPHGITKNVKRRNFIFLQMLNKYRNFKTDDNRITKVKARSEYKSILRKKRYDYDKKQTNRFVNAKHKNAKLYWSMLKESAGVKSANKQLSRFEQYFKAINNPMDPFLSPDEDVLYFNEHCEKDEFNIMFDELNLDFSSDEIIKSINQLKTNKFGGPDKIINEFLIHGRNVLVPTLCNLFKNKL